MSLPVDPDKGRDRTTWVGWLRRAVYVGLPVVILVLIFNRIDVPTFKANIVRTNPWLVALGLGYYPLAILVGATRWRFIVARYLKQAVPWTFLLRHYWIGLALGMFVPSSVGWDAYRIVAVGRKFGNWGGNLAALLAEKVVALLNIVVMIIVLFPLVRGGIVHDRSLAEKVFAAAVLVLLVLVLGGAALVVIRRKRLGENLGPRIEGFLTSRVASVSRACGHPIELDPGALSYSRLIGPLADPRTILRLLAFSFLIQGLGALHIQVFFRAVGQDIPLLVNFFLTPVFFLLFMLPISFGSLGIREGAYIIVYGLFGVPPEIALLVSFLNLSGLLFNNLIGALLIWTSPKENGV